jgi:hypothetical protein
MNMTVRYRAKVSLADKTHSTISVIDWPQESQERRINALTVAFWLMACAAIWFPLGLMIGWSLRGWWMAH